MTNRVFGLIAIVLVSSVAAPALAAESASPADTDASASADSSLTFETSGSALVDYAVGGDTVAESIRVQSQSEAEAGLSLGVGADLDAVAGIAGSGLSVGSEAGLQTTVQAESGATLSAHDNGHGSLVVESGGESQYVEVGLSDSTSAEAESDDRVVVRTEDGTTGAFLATGDGSVTVNDDGNVTAAIEGDDRLVFRAYTDAREEADRETEDLITSGSAAASVYVTGDGSDTVTYDGDTTVSITERAQGQVEMAVDRSSHDGKVIVTSVAESTFESAEDVQVTVDGEAAAQASSVAELEQATDGGENSRYMVRQRSSARASADVLVGVNHFSTREVAMSEGDSDAGGSDGASAGDGSNGDADGASADSDGNGDSTGATGPGFGVLGAVAAVLSGAALLARRGR